MNLRPIHWLLVVFVFFSCEKTARFTLELDSKDQISYNHHIRPILSDNCFACHGPDANKREAGLRLDIAEYAYAALKEYPDQFGVIPHDPKASVIFQRMTSTDPNEIMPPPESNLKLSVEEIDLIKRWIEQGAVYEPHWAFEVPQKKVLPQVKNKQWPVNEIDYFILSGMERQKLSPNPKADQLSLLRRLSLDLIGLPPTMELQQKFLSNKSAMAYEQMIDYLLALPAYGEKMAVLWMDISRYADSYGYQDDNIRTQWPYRDWVIHAFNKNMPYDQFITWQLAGDLLANATKEQILATAYNRNHKYTEEGGVIDEEYRVEYILDKTNTYTKGILGLTVECAQCHDHKYDPISQKNYFELFAFFNNTPEKGYEGDIVQSKPAKTPIMWIEREDTEGILNFINYQDTARIMVSVMEELKEVRPTFILDRGLYDAPTKEVRPNTPEAVFPFDIAYPPNRLGLAQWTTDARNPLTARVFVNLIWQEIFGKGIVASTGDFGMQGALPSHPELLDWLAVDFVENGWDIKRLLKQLLMSATYQQSSVIDVKKYQQDPDNTYLARAPRLRLSAESIRDMVLSSSGLLYPEIGGPSVKPYQPEGLWEAASSGRGELRTYKQATGNQLYRRGLYTFIKLTVPPPMPIIFDGSNRDVCEVSRSRTNTPLQALVMLNDPLVLEASRYLASELIQRNQEPKQLIEQAFSRILGRNPGKQELQILFAYYQEEMDRFTQDLETGISLIYQGEKPIDTQNIKPSLIALSQVITAIYNLEEAITKT
ncbi:PSD1 and planctomycete cytochrome C domain-containing protein [Mongoliitalea daihaiensis]|uniref:PSD1 and planctomycete cytochrome C domain-containing protein n=1 Tax=Mongoliitalea daihaiensis TaxID=2782006 RepID=UPI001F1EFB70|nr:PSD1 and planctomycete cytochrome C domain-containing protein [Mongoliitalea daihaiensis]UJP66581.1 PSD1 domain-containing protein [Mongoliitalea daihaiensis]